jgi:hypothetical protein
MIRTWVFEWHARFRADIKSETGEEQSQQHAHHFRWNQDDCSQRIRSGRPNSQSRILLWHCTATAWKCAKTSPGALVSCCIMTMHRLTLSFSPGNFWSKTTWLSFPTHPTFYVSLIEDKTERPPFWHIWGARGRIADGAEHPHRTRLPRRISKWQKRSEQCISVERDYFESDGGTRWRGLVLGWWLPAGSKIVFDQMAAPVPEIIYGAL